MLLLREKFCIDDPTRRNAFGGDIIKNQRACHIILVENTGAVCEKLCIDVRTRRDAFEGDNTKKHRACHIFLVGNMGPVCEKLRLDVRTRRNYFFEQISPTNTNNAILCGKHGPCLRNTARRRSSSSQEFFWETSPKKADNALLCQWETWSLFARSCTSPFELVASFSGGHHQKVQAMQYYLSGKHSPHFREVARRYLSSSQAFSGRHHQRIQVTQ